MSLISPALAGRFITTSAIWEAPFIPHSVLNALLALSYQQRRFHSTHFMQEQIETQDWSKSRLRIRAMAQLPSVEQQHTAG